MILLKKVKQIMWDDLTGLGKICTVILTIMSFLVVLIGIKIIERVIT